MKNFWYHHRQLYTRTLWGLVLVTTTLGALNVHADAPDRATSPAVITAAKPKTAAATPVSSTPSIIANSASLPPYGPVGTGNVQGIAQSMSAARFGAQHWPALYAMWQRESGWNPAARNRSSGACGIPQALPCSKIGDMTPAGQITWGLGYIASRYGNPTNAWHFWQIHHWY